MCPNASPAHVSAPSEPQGSAIWKSEVGNLPLPSPAKLGNPAASKDIIQAAMRWDRRVPWGTKMRVVLGGQRSSEHLEPARFRASLGLGKYSLLSQSAPCSASHSLLYAEPPGALRGRDGRGLFKGKRGHFRMTKITIHSKAIFAHKQNTTNERH